MSPHLVTLLWHVGLYYYIGRYYYTQRSAIAFLFLGELRRKRRRRPDRNKCFCYSPRVSANQFQDSMRP